MKRIFLILVVFPFFHFNNIPAQPNASINIYSRYYYLCKIWGYLKYFHSEVSRGVHDWDEILINTIDEVKKCVTDDEFNNAILDLFSKIGETLEPTTPHIIISESLRYNLSTDWFYELLISNNIRNQLEKVRDRFRPRNNYYVGQAFANGNPTFNNDKKFYEYGSDEYPEENKRLLALFRYWNIINYFYPYKNIIDQNWDSTLAEFIPKVVEAADVKSYHTVFLMLSTRLNDSHGFTTSQTINYNIFGAYYLPLELKFIENQTIIIKDYSKNVNIKSGDVIRSINSKSIESIRDSLKTVTIGSNEPTINRNINSYILRGTSTICSLELENDKGKKNISVRRVSSAEYNALRTNNTPIWNTIYQRGIKFGYVDMGRLENTQIDKMFQDLWGTDALIFDIRNYPKGTMWSMIRYLYYSPINIAKFTVPDITYPGTLKWISETIGTGDFTRTYEKDIYILFDETTQSQAEYTIMGFEQHPNSVKIGSQTAGADGNVSYIYLPGGIATVFTGLGVFYPDGKPTQRIGIVPDINVIPTIQGIREGRDEVLETAINLKQSKPSDASKGFYVTNFPNPFSKETKFECHAIEKGIVSIEIFDILGRCVKKLYDSETEAGRYYFVWNGNNNFNDKVSSGVYLVVMSDGKNQTVRKVILLR